MTDKFYNRLLAAAAFLGAGGVALGAFGAHFLKARLTPEDLATLQTGVLYLFVHVLALCVVALLGIAHAGNRLLRIGGLMFLIGIILFTGSLVIISTKSLSGIGIGIFGPITPLGGLCFILGWGCLMVYGWVRSRHSL